ncbi:MAG: DDE-type integrase/transposase/recombinase [Acidimicrobiales bacterium]
MLRIRAALEIEQGIIVNKKLVWKIMRKLSLDGLPGPKKRTMNLVNVATEEDLFSRKIVGWAIDRRRESTLVNDALSVAVGTRVTSESMVIDSDQGSQFTSWAFTETVRRLGLLLSLAMADYIENFYNPARRHNSIDYLTPAKYEALHLTTIQAGSS